MEFDGYTLNARLGDGGMSVVYQATENATGKVYALKILREESAQSPEEVRAFKAEADFMREIRVPGVVEAYKLGYVGRHWYMVLEYVDGYTFQDLLLRKQHVKEEDCLLIIESVAAALDFVWNEHGIVHCDIKPENIMINTSGVVKLTDLGISHRFQYLENGKIVVPEHVTGTPAYISPEQVYGDVELDCRTDIYSLGATIYHLATGRVLFPNLDNESAMRAHCSNETQARDPRLYRAELSEGFVQLLEAMLVKDRTGRMQDWKDVYAMCQEVEAGTVFKPRATPGVSSIKFKS